MNDDQFEPICDDDGVVLATTEQERRDLVEHALTVIAERAGKATLEKWARDVVRLAGRTGDSPVVVNGFVAEVKMGKTGPRQVNPHAIEAHREALDPIGLGPREVECGSCKGTGVRVALPGVAELASNDARAEIARVGLNADQFLIPGRAPEPAANVIPPKNEDQ